MYLYLDNLVHFGSTWKVVHGLLVLEWFENIIVSKALAKKAMTLHWLIIVFKFSFCYRLSLDHPQMWSCGLSNPKKNEFDLHVGFPISPLNDFYLYAPC